MLDGTEYKTKSISQNDDGYYIFTDTITSEEVLVDPYDIDTITYV